MPQDLEPLQGRVALPAGSVSVACFEKAILPLQLAILIPEPGHLAHLSADGSALLEPEQPLLASRLGCPPEKCYPSLLRASFRLGPWYPGGQRYLFRDNDGIYGHGVHAFLLSCGILEVRTAYRSPWQNPYVERMIGTLRRELLNHVIVLNQAHLERLLREFIADYYHPARPHQGLAGETPRPQAPSGKGALISIPVVGGLHHRYYRAAA